MQKQRTSQTDDLYTFENFDLPKLADGHWLQVCHSVSSGLRLRHLLVSTKRPKTEDKTMDKIPDSYVQSLKERQMYR
jgi:hypothetical protein